MEENFFFWKIIPKIQILMEILQNYANKIGGLDAIYASVLPTETYFKPIELLILNNLLTILLVCLSLY